MASSLPAIDRFPVGVRGAQLAVFPYKLYFGLCAVLTTGYPAFMFGECGETYVIIESQFILFAKHLADTCDFFTKIISSNYTPKNEKVILDTSSEEAQNQQIVQTFAKSNFCFEFHREKFCYSISFVKNQNEIISLIEVFLKLVLKAYCYSPLITQVIIICYQSIDIKDFVNLNEDKLFHYFEKLPPRCNSVDHYYLSELILRHKDLLYQMRRLEMWRNSDKKMAPTHSAELVSNAPVAGTSSSSVGNTFLRHFNMLSHVRQELEVEVMSGSLNNPCMTNRFRKATLTGAPPRSHNGSRATFLVTDLRAEWQHSPVSLRSLYLYRYNPYSIKP